MERNRKQVQRSSIFLFQLFLKRTHKKAKFKKKRNELDGNGKREENLKRSKREYKTMEERLMIACQEANWEIAEKLVSLGAQVLRKDKMERNALFFALMHSNIPCETEALLLREARNDVDAILEAACYAGNRRVMDVALRRGASNFEDALFGACYGANVELVEELWPKAAEYCMRGLEGACMAGSEELAALMVERGASVDLFAVQAACMGGNKKLVEKLLLKEREEMWSFNGACIGKNKEIVEMLVARTENDLSNTLGDACLSGEREIVELMMKSGGNNWNAGLFSACQLGSRVLMELMVSGGAQDWNEGLFGASSSGNIELMEEMISKGATDLNGALNMVCLHRPSSMEAVLFLIEKGAKPNFRDSARRTPLHLACESSVINPRLVRYLIERGADPLSKDSSFRTPLHLCCANRSVCTEILQMFLYFEANLYSQDDWSRSSLSKYVNNDSLSFDVLKLILEHNPREYTVDLSVKDEVEKKSILRLLCENSKLTLEMVKLVCDKQDKVDFDEALAGFCFNKECKIEILEFLLEKGGQPNYVCSEDNNTSFHLLCFENNKTESLRIFLEKGADPNFESNKKETPFGVLCKAESLDMEKIELMVKYGANHFDEALRQACASSKPSLQFLNYLIGKGASVNSTDVNQKTPLHFLCEGKVSMELLKLVLKEGANPSLTDIQGNSPLAHLVANEGADIEMIKLLHENSEVDLSLSLFDACNNPSSEVEIVEYIIKTGANVNFRDSNGRNALVTLCEFFIC